MQAAAEEVYTTQPLLPSSTILRTKWCVTDTALMALHSTFASCLSSGPSTKNPVSMYPALAKTTCTDTSLVASAISSRYPVFPRFTPTSLNSTFLNRFLSSLYVPFNTSSGSATSATLSPCFAHSIARLFPIPLLAPVTTAHSALYFFFRSTGGMRFVIPRITMYPAKVTKAPVPRTAIAGQKKNQNNPLRNPIITTTLWCLFF
mmetsp:Transcript_5209/g.18257  ORF Transcript_5209/g.18257 Transcript_5209/m.18257 type:complete len:204 (-) Transcript_5209:191-802(-)